jgi:hypothetical protein
MAKPSNVLAMIAASLIAAVAAIVTAACSSEKGPPPLVPTGLTFTTDIEPLVQQKCQSCHREGGIAPFPLVTYEQVKDLGAIAKEKIVQRQMPPWGAFDTEACTVNHRFKSDLSLTQEQIDKFAQWVDGGMPRGDAPPDTTRPATATTSSSAGLRDKTHTFEVAKPYEIPALGNDEFRCFPVDPGFQEDAWVTESMVVPGDPKVVHHALLYIDAEHEGASKVKPGEVGYPCFGGPELKQLQLVLAWSPGGVPTAYGENAALRVPKGAHLVLQVHYHPIDTRTTGQLAIELKNQLEPPARIAGFVLLGNAESGVDGLVKLLPGPSDPAEGVAFLIPSNAKAHTESMELTIPDDIEETKISAVGAHMHWAGVGMTLEVLRKRTVASEPANECLLSAPKYDFNWQRTYAYDDPIAFLPIIRGGDKLRITCTFDNTKDNPNIARLMKEQRLTEPAPIRLGPESRDEMCQAMIVFVD